MSQAADLFGVTYQVPEVRDTGWGPAVTSLLLQLMKVANGLALLPGSVPLLKVVRTDSQSLGSGGTLSWVSSWHRVAGTPGAVTLSASTPIAAGGAGGQFLILTGTSDTNTVRINHGGNIRLNGDVILALGDVLVLLWDDQDVKWWELYRNS